MQNANCLQYSTYKVRRFSKVKKAHCVYNKLFQWTWIIFLDVYLQYSLLYSDFYHDPTRTVCMYDFLPGWMRQVKDLTAHALWTIYRRICFPCTTHLQVSNAPRFLFYQQKSLVFLGLSLYHSCPLIVFSLNFLSISLSGTVLANSVFLFAFWCKCSPVLFF